MVLILFSGQSTFAGKDGAFGKAAKKKGGYVYDDTDFLGLDFFEKKRYQGLPPGLSGAVDPFSNDQDFPEVEIVIGDPSKFGKSRRLTENQPAVDDSESEEASSSTSGEQNGDIKAEETQPSTVLQPEDDEKSEFYKPRVTSWGMFPRPQDISKAVNMLCNLLLDIRFNLYGYFILQRTSIRRTEILILLEQTDIIQRYA
jgi:hypothetical protein